MAFYTFTTATTANGFLADEHDALDWLFAVEGDQPDLSALLDGVRVLVMGSTTYEWLLRHEALLEHPEKVQEFWPDVTVLVFSSRELAVPDAGDIRVVSGAVTEHLATIDELAGERGRVWIMGGGDLAGQFLDAGVLDEIAITIAPAFLAAGRELFPRALHGARLRLRDTWRVGEFVEVRYDVARA